MDKVEVVGFDYDYTLAEYTPALQFLIYDCAKKILLDKRRYPAQLAEFTFDPTFAIRGLVFDRNKGLFLKLSSRHEIALNHVSRGRRSVPQGEVLEIYGGSRHLSSSYIAEYLHPIHDLFATAEACLLADVIQLAVDLGFPFVPHNLSQDVRAAIQEVHESGEMHRTVAANPHVYQAPIPGLAGHLKRWLDDGKKLFLMTNSGLTFVDAGMRFLVGDDWRSRFDLVIVQARKPYWYKTRIPFRRYNETNEFVKWDAVTAADVARGRVLVGGSYPALLEMMPTWTGDRVLYMGDQLQADLKEPARITGWATGAIVRELDHETAVLQSPEYHALFEEGNRLAERLDAFQQAGSSDDDGGGNAGGSGNDNGSGGDSKELVTAVARQAELDKMDELRSRNYYQRAALFNKRFGSVFRSETDASFLGFQIKRYVDVYTSRLDNLLAYPVDHRFFAQRSNQMPHERRIAGHLVC